MFEVNTTVTRESCRVQAKARLAQHIRRVHIVIIGLALAGAILLAIHSPKADIVAAVFGVVVLYNLLVVRMTAMRLYSSRNAAVNSILLTFGEDRMRITTGVEDTFMNYDKVVRLAENRDYIIIYAEHYVPIAFRKSEVLGQRADGLKAFLEAKTGRSFRPIHR